MQIRWRLNKKSWWVAIGLLLFLWVHGCAQTTGDRPDSASDSTNIQVVSTSTILTDFANQIRTDRIQVNGILKPGDDPHVYEPVPRDSKALEDADLILYNGYNLEPGLIRMMDATATQARKLAVAEALPPLQMEKDGAKVPDPHVWGNVQNAIVMVNTIRDALIDLTPADRETLTANASRLVNELEQLHTWIGQQVATIPAAQRKLVTSHDAFQYYARAYGLDVPGTLIGISTEEQPSARTVQQLVKSIQTLKVPAIFAETTINPRLITTVAEEAGVRLADRQLYSDSIGAPGSEAASYRKMMVFNTTTIVEALGGKVAPFQPNPASK